MTFPLADEILRRLLEAEGRPLSGQVMAGSLGVTRAAVWKGVRALQGQGYPIQSEPARGYRLAAVSPGRVRPGEITARLRTKVFGRSLRCLGRVDSTNREAERWAEEGGPEGALIVAEEQTAGRGRLGRSWHGGAGTSLLFSVLLRPGVPPAEAPLLTFVAAVALADALLQAVPAEAVEVKWPNDVLLRGRKTAGILLEARTEGQSLSHVILGVGINVSGKRESLPEDLRRSATTLAAESEDPVERLRVLCGFLEAFEAAYQLFLEEGFEALRPRWNRWFRMAGKPVRVTMPAAVLEGIALGLGPAGELLVETSSRETRAVYAGDVEFATTRI